jgi:hypothetical protein
MMRRFLYPLAAAAAAATSVLGQTTPRFLETQAATPSWITGYLVHYEYCLHADNLVAFRLCPESSCEAGCRHGGEYLVDIEFFTSTFLTAQSNLRATECDAIRAACQDGESDNECFATAQAYYCMDDDDINDGMDFQVENYSSCTKVGNNLYAGPYCGPDNHHIYLGAFTDADCTVVADDGAFEAAFGYSLPYGWYTDQSVVGDGCVSCHDSDGVLEQCDDLYQAATAKCEVNMKVENANVDACDEIKQMKKEEGIRAVRKGGAGRIIATILLALAAAAAVAAMILLWRRKTKAGATSHDSYRAQEDSK